jgi:hypothetical protein
LLGVRAAGEAEHEHVRIVLAKRSVPGQSERGSQKRRIGIAGAAAARDSVIILLSRWSLPALDGTPWRSWDYSRSFADSVRGWEYDLLGGCGDVRGEVEAGLLRASGGGYPCAEISLSRCAMCDGA